MLSGARISASSILSVEEQLRTSCGERRNRTIELLAPDITSDRHRGGGPPVARASIGCGERRADAGRASGHQGNAESRRAAASRTRRQPRNLHRRPPRNLHRRQTRPRRRRPSRKPLPQPRNRRLLRRQPVRSRLPRLPRAGPLPPRRSPSREPLRPRPPISPPSRRRFGARAQAPARPGGRDSAHHQRSDRPQAGRMGDPAQRRQRGRILRAMSHSSPRTRRGRASA